MNYSNKRYHHDHKRKLAKTSISTSAFRNQGESGLIRLTQDYIIKNIDLEKFEKSLRTKKYKVYLDEQTKLLKRAALNKNCKWGTARKGLNIFFRDVLYNSYFFKKYSLKFEYGHQLEIPLDSKTMIKIGQKFKKNNLKNLGYTLPLRSTIIGLSQSVSDVYQAAATKIAEIEYDGYTRVDLDMEFWAETEGGTSI